MSPSTAVLVGALVGAALLLVLWPRDHRRELAPIHPCTRPQAEPGRAAPAREAASERRGARGLVRIGAALAGRVRGTDPSSPSDLLLMARADALAAALAAGLDVQSAHDLVVTGRGVTAGSGRAAVSRGAQVPGAAETVGADPLARRAGESARDAWARVGRESVLAASLAHALEVSERVGSPARTAVCSAVATHRERLAAHEAISAAVAGARATGRLLTMLPLAGPLAVLALGLDPVMTYGTPAALASSAVGIVLTVVGHRWLTRQVTRAGRETTA